MTDRHLQLVTTRPPADDYAITAAATLRRAGDYVRRRGGTMEITITDVDGIELAAEPIACDETAFVVRAEAHFRTVHSETVVVGISEPIERDDFIAAGQHGYLSAQAEAVHDLVVQLRPHRPAEVVR